MVFRGDSRTVGVGTTDLKNTPNQCINVARNPNWLGYTIALGGELLTAAQANAATQVDPLFDSSKRCVVCLLEGTNDMAGGATAATMWTNMKAFCASRKAAKAWETWLHTELDRSGYAATLATLNTSIRGGDVSIDRVLQCGYGDPFPSLGDATDTRLFNSDQLHPNNGGSLLRADFISRAIGGA
jgi:hypothetical protein